jgi:hypothetical protein
MGQVRRDADGVVWIRDPRAARIQLVVAGGALVIAAALAWLWLRPSAPDAPEPETLAAREATPETAAAREAAAPAASPQPDAPPDQRQVAAPRTSPSQATGASRQPQAPGAPPPASARPPASAGTPEEDAMPEPPEGEKTGIQAFPPPGTKPLMRGIIVPEGYRVPPGYVAHVQWHDGALLPPILMFEPGFQPRDANGNPIPTPANRVVPPELAPRDLPQKLLDLPPEAPARP